MVKTTKKPSWGYAEVEVDSDHRFIERHIKAARKQIPVELLKCNLNTKTTYKWQEQPQCRRDTLTRTQPVLTVMVIGMVREGAGWGRGVGAALMACCQGDTDQQDSVSFADANETLEVPGEAPLNLLWRHKLRPRPPTPPAPPFPGGGVRLLRIT